MGSLCIYIVIFQASRLIVLTLIGEKLINSNKVIKAKLAKTWFPTLVWANCVISEHNTDVIVTTKHKRSIIRQLSVITKLKEMKRKIMTQSLKNKNIKSIRLVYETLSKATCIGNQSPVGAL